MSKKIHGNMLNNEKIIKQFFSVHSNKYNYSEMVYSGDNVKIKIICPIHGVFEQTPGNHKRGQKCPKCTGRNLEATEIINQLKLLHDNKYDYSKVIIKNSSSKIIIICPTHGEFTQTINNHKSGQGCQKCYGNEKSTLDNVIYNFISVHGDKYDYSLSNYVNAHKKIKIICKTHGIFEQTPNNHKHGNGCPSCKESYGEMYIRVFLDKNKIKYISQYKFNDCKNKLSLPFDFYLPEHNLCIEYNGMQHYKPIEYFGGIKGFKQRKNNDKIKKEYCKKNNIPLIIIKYNENIENKLLKSGELTIDEVDMLGPSVFVNNNMRL